ncbi:MAG: TIGR03086 family protein [Actinobacteria bacterium]|nr:TIGR03086 family protein [Actinomycetota bacterium]
MDQLAALARSADLFESKLAAVSPDALSEPTPCEGWDVAELIRHSIAGATMSAALLRGASREEAVEMLTSIGLEQDLTAQFRRCADDLAAAFAEPGALERTVAHPAMDMPGGQLLGFRIGDNLVHAWDLARATGGDESLDDEVVAIVWENVQPMRPFIGQVGVFGDGPSDAYADAPLALQLLDFMGRRP